MGKLARRAGYLAAAAGVVLLVIFWRHGPGGDAGLQHWLAVHTGTNYCAPGMAAEALRTCKAYGYWSGFGSVIPWSLGILGVVTGTAIGWLHHVNCATDGCWRKGKFPMAGGQYRVCRRCHDLAHGLPAGHKITIGHIRDHHVRHGGQLAGPAQETPRG